MTTDIKYKSLNITLKMFMCISRKELPTMRTMSTVNHCRHSRQKCSISE